MPAKKAEATNHRIPVDGGWVRMRPMSIDDLEVLGDADKDVSAALRQVKDACIEAQFDNGLPLGQQPTKVLTSILRAWNEAEDSDALPPANGQPSA